MTILKRYIKPSIRSVSMEELTTLAEAVKTSISNEAVLELNSQSAPIAKLVELKAATKDFITSAFSSIASFFGPKAHKPEDALAYYKWFAENMNYMDVKDILLNVPMGFQGNMVEYTKAVTIALVEVNKRLVPDLVKPFDIYVGKLINQPILLETHSFKHAIKMSDIEKYKASLGKFVSARKHNQLPIGKIYNRIKEFDEHREVLINLFHLSKTTNVNEVQEAVNELNTKLDVLIGMLSDQTNNINPTAKVVNDLADLTLDLAKKVEFFAVVDNLTGTLQSSALDNVDLLKRITK